MAVQCQQMVDTDVELDRCGVDRQHLHWAQRRKQPGREVFAGKLEPWRAVLLEDHHNGVRLDAHQAVEGMRIPGELHAQRRLLHDTLLAVAGVSRRLPIKNSSTE